MTRLWLIPMAVIGLLAVGCGGRSDVTGTVTRGGQPMPAGSVSFTPNDGLPGSGATAAVTEGQFRVPAERALRPGRYSVVVTPDAPPGVDPESLPASTFVQYETTIEVRDQFDPVQIDLPVGSK